MAGLQSLMQKGQMPGQAGMFSALPAQQGRNPVAYTRALKQTPPEELIRIYNDPNDLRPKWAVASAYADAMKAKALRQGATGQRAMAQNAAEQQQPPVADEVMSVMAASGGEMKSYADGGAIGFSKGGSNDVFTVLQRLSEEVQKAEQASVAADQALQRYGPVQRQQDPQGFERAKQAAAQAQKALDDARKAYRAGPPMTAGVPQARLAPEPVAAAETAKPASEPKPRVRPDEAPVIDESRVEPPPQVPPTERPPSGLASLSEMSGYEKRLEEEAKKLMDLLRKQGEVSPEVKTARGEVQEARERQLQQAESDIGRIRGEGIRQLQGRLERARMPLIDDPEALLAIAAAIDPRKGKAIGSLASGAASVLGERRARAEKAEDAVSALNEKMRLLNNQYMEAQALEKQRRLAQLTGDTEGMRAADIAAQRLAVEIPKTQAEIAVRLQDVQAKRETAQATRESVAASRAGTELNRLQLALGNRQKVYQDAKEEWAKGQDVKLAAMQASLPGAKPEDVDKWRKMQQDFDAAFKNSQEIRNLDAAIAAMSRSAGVPMPSAQLDTSGWGQLQVTEQPKK